MPIQISLLATVTTIAIFLAGCGRQDNASAIADGTETTPPAIQEPDIPECILNDLSDNVDLRCASVVYRGTLLAGVTESTTSIVATAARRGGGSGGTRWFDARRSFKTARNLNLPLEIPATGNAANGHKLYVKFNDQIDCVWYSHAGVRYRNPRCFVDATRAPGNSLGFSGGTEVDNTRVSNVLRLSITVNGSGGGGSLTIATATFNLE